MSTLHPIKTLIAMEIYSNLEQAVRDYERRTDNDFYELTGGFGGIERAQLALNVINLLPDEQLVMPRVPVTTLMYELGYHLANAVLNAAVEEQDTPDVLTIAEKIPAILQQIEKAWAV